MRVPFLFLLTLLLAGAGFAVPHARAEENQIVFGVEPSQANPRNSEGSFVRLKSGRILFYYSQFYGGSGDETPARIAGIHSDDDGRTWSQPETIVKNTAAGNIMSVSLLRLASGKIAFFYIVRNSWIDSRPCVRFSTDEAATWSEPKLVVPAPGYFVLNNDRVVQSSTGRIVVPVAFHRSKLAEPLSAKSFDGRGIAMWYYSDDDGQTWQEANSWWALPISG
jgi:Neuraminidase (sialidase)